VVVVTARGPAEWAAWVSSKLNDEDLEAFAEMMDTDIGGQFSYCLEQENIQRNPHTYREPVYVEVHAEDLKELD
jgi:hypothetical protein